MRAQSRASTGPSGSWRSTTRTRGGYLPNGVAKLLRVEPSHLHPEGSWPSALASRPQTDLKVMATGLGIGILLDATIVRSLLVPSLVSLFGPWNWYLPARFARMLRVQPSYPHPERDEPLEPLPEPVG